MDLPLNHDDYGPQLILTDEDLAFLDNVEEVYESLRDSFEPQQEELPSLAIDPFRDFPEPNNLVPDNDRGNVVLDLGIGQEVSTSPIHVSTEDKATSPIKWSQEKETPAKRQRVSTPAAAPTATSPADRGTPSKVEIIPPDIPSPAMVPLQVQRKRPLGLRRNNTPSAATPSAATPSATTTSDNPPLVGLGRGLFLKAVQSGPSCSSTSIGIGPKEQLAIESKIALADSLAPNLEHVDQEKPRNLRHSSKYETRTFTYDYKDQCKVAKYANRKKFLLRQKNDIGRILIDHSNNLMVIHQITFKVLKSSGNCGVDCHPGASATLDQLESELIDHMQKEGKMVYC